MTAGLASAFALTVPSHAVTLQSGFAGDYDPANWTLTTSPYIDSGSAFGTVDTTGAPSSITLIANGPSATADFTQYTTTATAAGLVSFNWNFSKASAGYSTLFYILNGSSTFISLGALSNTGATSFTVADGDTFGFKLQLKDGLNTSSATATISNFSAPIPSSAPATSSVPGPLPILGLAAAFGFSRRLRRRINLAKSSVSTDSVAVEQL